MVKKNSEFEQKEESDVLVVVLHAFTQNPKNYNFIKDVVKREFPNADVWIPLLPLTLFSNWHPNKVVEKLINQIDEIIEKKKEKLIGEYKKILFIGHSSGTILSRKIYIVACGENNEAPFENIFKDAKPKAWAQKIDRIIQMGAMNKGWTLSDQLPLSYKIGFSILLPIGKFLTALGRKLFILQTSVVGNQHYSVFGN